MANMNPDTSGLIPYEKGKSGNRGGKTSKQKRVEMRNAERAMVLRGRLLDAMETAWSDLEPEALLEHLTPSTLKMLKDSEDRGLGAPVQPVTSPDEAMRPTIIELVAPTQEEVLATLKVENTSLT